MWWFRQDPAKAAEKRLRRARRFMVTKDYNEVRLELVGVEGPEAEELRRVALSHLVVLNLAEARFRLATGEREDAGNALGRARAFGATPDQLNSVRYHSQATGGWEEHITPAFVPEPSVIGASVRSRPRRRV